MAGKPIYKSQLFLTQLLFYGFMSMSMFCICFSPKNMPAPKSEEHFLESSGKWANFRKTKWQTNKRANERTKQKPRTSNLLGIGLLHVLLCRAVLCRAVGSSQQPIGGHKHTSALSRFDLIWLLEIYTQMPNKSYEAFETNNTQHLLRLGDRRGWEIWR